VAGVVLALLTAVSLLAPAVERRLRSLGTRKGRFGRVMRWLATVPSTLAMGVRTAADHVRHPRASAGALVGALGWWAGNIGILWASFHAFGVEVPFGVLVMGYFLGMVANLAPSPAAGVGTVDIGLISAFVVFGIDSHTVFPAILTFRIIGYWLPIPAGVFAYLKLRKTVQRWSDETRAATIQSKVKAEAT
jgi:uncharacterized membrane protein YbhN (UPF0104 family)